MHVLERTLLRYGPELRIRSARVAKLGLDACNWMQFWQAILSHRLFKDVKITRIDKEEKERRF